MYVRLQDRIMLIARDHIWPIANVSGTLINNMTLYSQNFEVRCW